MAKTLIHEELYRTASLLQKMAQQELIICGAGAIGSNLIDNITRQGFKNISVIDMDRVEDHNRHTQIWNTRDIGQFKASAMKNYVYTSMGIQIKENYKKLDGSNVKKFLKTFGIVIDGFDNVQSRALVTNYCKESKTECLHIGLFKDYAEIIWNDAYRIPDDTKALDVCEYPLARNIVMLAVVVGTESLIRFVNSKVKENFIITLKDLKISKI